MTTLTRTSQLSKRLDAFEIELAQRNVRPQTKLYASSFMDCARNHAYKLLGYAPTEPEQIIPDYKRSALFGDAIHGAIQQRLVESGMALMIPNFDYDEKVRSAARAKGDLSPAIEVPLNEWTLIPEKYLEFKQYNLGGRIDGILQGKDGPIILEIKTVAGKYFQANYQRYYNEKLYHFEEQAALYAHFWGANKAIILVVNRDTSAFDEWVITANPNYIQPALERILSINESVKRAELPEPEPTRGPCNFCGFRSICIASDYEKGIK